MTSIRRRSLIAAAALAAGALTAPAHAQQQAWPTRTITIVVPFAPGGSNDVIARQMAPKFQAALGQNVVVENRAGAGSVVGANHVARSAADGHTLLFVSSSLSTTAATQDTPYDATKAFTSISRVATAPFVFMARKDFPAKNLQEMIAYAKANPGKMNYGSAGFGDSVQLATELFNLVAGIKMTGINYKGIAPAQLDLVGGRLDLVITTVASIKGTVAESLPMLAVSSARRNADLPNIPTVREAGIDYVVDVWWGLFGPAGMPDAVTRRINGLVGEFLKEDEFRKFLNRYGAGADHSSPEQLQQLLVSEIARWRKTVDDAKLRPAK
jgi:tripartite-type tricarboxylate transporter receptor subunit TctC